MDQVVPWSELATAVEPIYPKVSPAGGRPPVPLERMLRIYFLQLWFNLSDPAVEEALYDSEAMRRFAGIDLGQEAAPDETTVCKFRHLLERNGMGKTLLMAINRYLHENGAGLHFDAQRRADACLPSFRDGLAQFPVAYVNPYLFQTHGGLFYSPDRNFTGNQPANFER